MLFSPVYKESDSRPLALSLEVFTLLALSFEGSLEGLLFSPLRPVAFFPNPLNLQSFQHSNAVLPVSCPPRPHHLPLSPFDFSALPKPFRINTCELVYRCGKQRTYGKAKFIRINRVEKSLHLCLAGLRIRWFDPIAEASELPKHLRSAELLRSFGDRWAPFFVTNSLVQDQPDQPTLSMGDGPNGLIVSQARDRAAIHDLEDASFGSGCGVSSLME